MPGISVHPQLRDVLAQLYNKEVTIRRVINDAGLNETEITWEGSPKDIWQSILEESEKGNKTEDVIEVAFGQYPGNEPLKKAIEDYKSQKHEQEDSTAEEDGSDSASSSAEERITTTPDDKSLTGQESKAYRNELEELHKLFSSVHLSPERCDEAADGVEEIQCLIKSDMQLIGAAKDRILKQLDGLSVKILTFSDYCQEKSHDSNKLKVEISKLIKRIIDDLDLM